MQKSRAGSKALLIVLALVLLIGGAKRYRTGASQQLIEAAKAGDTAAVTSLIHRFADLNYKDPDGVTPLASAVGSGQLDTADLLVTAGADPNARIIRGGSDQTPLTIALIKGNVPLAHDLLARGAIVNPPKASPLAVVLAHMRPGSNNLSDFEKLEQDLLSRGVQVNPPGLMGAPPIVAAAATGRTDLVEDLLKRGADVNTYGPQGVSALSTAAGAGDEKMWSFLLEHGATVDQSNGVWAQVWAKYCQDSGWIGRLKAAHVNVNCEGQGGAGGETALMLVTVSRRDRMTSSDTDNSSPVAKVNALLALGANPRGRSKDGESPLVFASRDASIEVVKLLLAHGASLEEVGLNRETPLLRAARSQRSDLVQFFLQAGAKPNVFDARGNTPLMYEAINDTPPVAAMLLEHGANPDLADTARGRTALMLAAETSHLKMMELLLQHHARIDVKDQDGQTVLAYAVRRPDTGPTQLLLAAGAKPDLPDNHGATPLQLAQHLKHDKVVALLTQQGASSK